MRRLVEGRGLYLGWMLLFGSSLLLGCSTSTPPETAEHDHDHDHLPYSETRTSSRGDSRARPSKPLPVSSEDGPEDVVRAFLEAARTGQDGTATLLLTDKAREEIEREGLVLDPPGTPSMKYQLGKVEYHEQDPHAAYVNTLWIESLGATDERFEVVWVLRRQSQGWRIAGQAAQVDTTQPPVFLNFEDPEDVARIKSEIAAEPASNVARRPRESAEATNR